MTSPLLKITANLKQGVNENSPFQPLWVSGLALLVVVIGNWWLPHQNHRNEWLLYLALGTVFPALIVWLALANRTDQVQPRVLHVIKVASSSFCVLLCAIYLTTHIHIVPLILAVATLVISAALWRSNGSTVVSQLSYPLEFLISAISWTVSWQILWWDAVDNWSLLRSVGRLFLALIFLCLVFKSLPEAEQAQEDGAINGGKARPDFLSFAFNMIAVVIIGLASVRAYFLFDALSFVHWGFYIGPAELVRQGGYLLWDVPSQYGFLSILTLALFPAKSVWQSLYTVNAILLFLSGCLLFFTLRLWKQGLINGFFSLLVTLAAVFLLPGWAPEQIGPQGQPNIGPLRFFWCYSLIVILLWNFRSASSNYFIPGTGCLIWLLGVLWSFESAIYCTVIWIPAYVLIIWRRSTLLAQTSEGHQHSLTQIIGFLLLPGILLGMAIGAITFWYRLRLGHAPDWYAFVEYAFSYSTDYAVATIDPQAPFWALFMIFCVLSTVTAYFIRNQAGQPALSLLVGVWGLLWGTTSWFVAIGSPSRLLNLSPVFCLSIGVMFLVSKQATGSFMLTRLVRISLAPVVAVLLTAAFGSRTIIPSLRSMTSGYVPEIDQRLPPVDPALLELFQKAQVQPTHPVAFVDANHLGRWPVLDSRGSHHISTPRYWLPAVPYILLAPLPPTRRKIYVQRFTRRAKLAGWLIQHKDVIDEELSTEWLLEQTRLTHTPTRFFENEKWQLSWFEIRKG